MRLNVQALTVSRAGQPVITDLSFEAHSGEGLIIKGENGVGKSTLLRALCGLLPIESGSVELFDENGKCFENALKEYTHYLGHKKWYESYVNGSREFAILASIYGGSAPER